MRVWIILGSSILVLFTCGSFAQDLATPPTRVCEVGIYGCPNHADILATWPARCPLCQTVLGAAPASAATVASITPAVGRDSVRPGDVTREIQRQQQWRERQRQNEQWREWGQRNEELRKRARRNAELRELARRNEQLRQGYPKDSYRPSQRYAYPYPYNYYFNPDTGQYEYLRPGQAYPYGGYQYNPNVGQRYYNPTPEQYYYNPNAGHYYYDPYTGQYVYVSPRYASTSANIGPGIDMDNRRRNEEEEARAARRNEELREQARRNAELWGWYPNYGFPPAGGYPYTYPPPAYAYRYPYDYYHWNPGYAGPYGGYYYNPNTGQYHYRPKAGQYSYNPNTGQYEYMNPEYAPPNPRNDERRERAERQRR